MKNISIARLFFVINTALVALVLGIGYLAYQTKQLDTKLQAAQQNRFESYNLALELRESSEELTKMARSYVCTGNLKYEKQYQKILDIRNGLRKRPDGRKIALKTLMKQAGFTQAEFAKLAEAEDQSNALVEIELKAMYAVKGLFPDKLGNFIQGGVPDRDYAIELMFNDEYFGHKETIMQPIDELIAMVDKRTTAKVNKIQQLSNHFHVLQYVFTFLTVLLITISFLIIRKKIIKPLQMLRRHAEKIAIGNLETRIDISANDEVGFLAQSINTLADGIKAKSDFVNEIAQGNLSESLTPLSKEDKMAISLIEMQGSLQKAQREAEKRELEEKERNWITEGLAKFGEILRRDNDNIEKLAHNINANMVRYLNANQGSLFVINDKDSSEVFIEQVASFAFERQRRAEKRIELSEGLVGRCVDESETIYITQVPNDYINITSGLGDSPPKSLLLVPLKLNDEVFGVIEIASFNEFKPFEIEFVEKIGESIASTLSSVKISQRTNELLQVAQEKTEAMAAQEEELRQNLEELEATQNALDAKDKEQREVIEKLNRQNQEKLYEMEAKEAEMASLLQAMNESALVAEFDLDGKVIEMNDKFLTLLKAQWDEVVGKEHKDLMADAVNLYEYNTFWQELQSGKTKKDVVKYSAENENLWVSATYTPILDKDGTPHKILCIAENITHIKEQEAKVQKLLDESREKEEQLRRNVEQIETAQQALKKKDEEQKKEIEVLQQENDKKIQEIIDLQKEQEQRNKETAESQKQILEKFAKNMKTKEQKLNQELEKARQKIKDLEKNSPK